VRTYNEVRQDEQGAQEVGGAGGIGAEFGEDPPGFDEHPGRAHRADCL
jgi:hypothetical protein